MRTAVVFGGSGQLGVAVAEHLLDSGWCVTIVTRSGRPPGEALARRATVLDGAGRSRTALIGEVGQLVDGVFDPTAYDEADALDLLRARGRFGGLVVVSSASIYADAEGRSLVEHSQSPTSWPAGPIAEDGLTVAPGPET